MKASLHLARAGARQSANGIVGCRLLRAVRLACEQNWRRLFLEEGELEFFKANGITCLSQAIRHVLRRPIVTGSARGPVATIGGGNLLQRLQMAEGALPNREIGLAAGRRAADHVISLGKAVYGSRQQNGSKTDIQAGFNEIR